MGLTNFDASAYTKMRQQSVLYGYNRALLVEQNANNTTRREQPYTQSISVINDRRLGNGIAEYIEVNANSNNPNIPPLYLNSGSNITSFNPSNINGAAQ